MSDVFWQAVIAGIVTLGLGWMQYLTQRAVKEASKASGKRAEAVASKVEETAKVLAATTEAAGEKVLGKIEESHKANYEAIDKANHTNEKILKIAEAQAEMRKPTEPMKVELTGSPGILEPLIVTQKPVTKRRRK